MHERDLLNSALEIDDESARRAFLDTTCAGDPALRTRVERLLIQATETGNILERTASDPNSDRDTRLLNIEGQPTDMDPPTTIDKSDETRETLLLNSAESTTTALHVNTASPPRNGPGHDAPQLGTLFGRYRVERELGAGGMGVVYLAEDLRLRRRVALKIPKLDPNCQAEFVERFQREARTMASVLHRNLCPVFDVDEQDGTHYLTMAFIDGEPLSRVIKYGPPFSARQIAELIGKLAQALAAAHRAGVVHRDLKPGNVMVDRGGEPILMDFGLARTVNEFDARVTQSGTIIGTPAYMSPEQAEGDVSKVGPASDIYSLGAILYELLAGQTIHSGSTTRVLASLLSKDATRPSDIRRDIDPRLEEICLKAISRRAEDRFHTADEFAAALADFLNPQRAETSDPIGGGKMRGRLPDRVAISDGIVERSPDADTIDYLQTRPPQRRTSRSVLAGLLLIGTLGAAWAIVAGRVTGPDHAPPPDVAPSSQQAAAAPSLGPGATGSSGVTGSAEPAVHPARFALLIGVGKYAHLSDSEQLRGSANDVAAMHQLLVERFRFSPQNVTTLKDEQATGDGIRVAMRSLSDAIVKLPAGAPPAQIVVHFSGHGSQVQDQPTGLDHDEDDGLDETWVPYNATKQGGDEDIRDDEINGLVNEISQEGRAQLLVIMDCCHSGTGARGTTRIRQLSRGLAPTKPVSLDVPIHRKRLPENAVFMSACRAREVEPEFQDGDKTYGLLTRFLVESLSQERAVSQLSYERLQQVIVAHYQRDRRILQAPTPQLEGNPTALRSAVLGFGPQVDLPPYYEAEIVSSGSQALLRAGRFHSLTVGSLFELFERPEQALDTTQSVSWLRTTKVDGVTSEAQVIRWEDAEQTKALPIKLPPTWKKGFAVPRYLAPGATGLRLKLVQAESPTRDHRPLRPGDAEVPAVIAAAIGGLAKPGESEWLHWITEEDDPCDLVLRMDGHYAALFPATGVVEADALAMPALDDVPLSLRGGWGPIDLRTGRDASDPPRTLSDYLRLITRARNLISLAKTDSSPGASDYKVQFELLEVQYDFDQWTAISMSPWKPDADGAMTMREKQVYALRVANHDQVGKPIYVTVLEIRPSMGIQLIEPHDEPPIKLEPGEKRDSEPFLCTSPDGLYRAVVLATREPSDFGYVAQGDLPKTRGAAASGGAGALTEQLAELTLFQPPKTRGERITRKRTAATWHADVLTWRVTK